jgi:hypothetical protein
VYKQPLMIPSQVILNVQGLRLQTAVVLTPENVCNVQMEHEELHEQTNMSCHNIKWRSAGSGQSVATLLLQCGHTTFEVAWQWK